MFNENNVGKVSIQNFGGFNFDDLSSNPFADLLSLALDDTDEVISEEEKRQDEERHIREVTSMELPVDYENVFDTDVRAQDVHVDSISDALTMSLLQLGRVDIEYISSITSVDIKDCIYALKGSIFQNPDKWDECFYKGWETKEEYLSGNLIAKRKIAEKANEKYQGYFQENIVAINSVLPQIAAATDIHATLGSPWIPTDIIDDFIEHLLGKQKRWRARNNDEETLRKHLATKHDEITGTWEIPYKDRYFQSVESTSVYGTRRRDALKILEDTLNIAPIKICDEKYDYKTNKIRSVVNRTQTLAAQEKQRLIIQEFRRWVWSDFERKERLERIFEEKFGAIRRRVFDGSFLTFPGMSPDVSLYPYQKDAVARMIFSDNTLLAHDVGSGKTYEMIAAGQELKRMGVSKKNMYVVPNNIISQWSEIYKTMYPDANILVVDSKSFIPKKRKAMIERIRDEEFDAIIITYFCFKNIPVSVQYAISEISEKLKDIDLAISNSGKKTGKLISEKKRLQKKLQELKEESGDSKDVIYFDELGVDRLFVDEAHNFKNLSIPTRLSRVNGIGNSSSVQCTDMYKKVKIVQKRNQGRGVVFATGTPVTNSITELFVMQLYLQSGELELLDLQTFDAWAGMFAEITSEFEIDVDTSNYRMVSRFSKFHNIPELSALISSIADFHSADDSADLPKFDGYDDIIIRKTPEFQTFLNEISKRAESVRARLVDRKDDNMLKITTDGRMAALDLRLYNPNASYSSDSKIGHCSRQAADIYFSTMKDKSTQLIFCDISTPKQDFNVYDELKDKLMLLGVPENQIAYIHDAATDKERDALLDKVRKGDIRILIGSTIKLGTGVNVQDKLYAIHHIDVPWRPSDMIQREGRIIRQGNTNPKVHIYRYITDGSFDAYSWQILETKQKFISSLLSGTAVTRSASDIDNTVLNYAEVKALAVGNPLIKKRVEVENELNRYRILQKKAQDNVILLRNELADLPSLIDNAKKRIDECTYDLNFYSKYKLSHKKDSSEKRREIRERIDSALKSNAFSREERAFMTFRGFTFILPTNMNPEKPYLWVERAGKYKLELGSAEVGNLIRVENFLDSFDKHLDDFNENLQKLYDRKDQIEKYLGEPEDYTEIISNLEDDLTDIDDKLGVNDND